MFEEQGGEYKIMPIFREKVKMQIFPNSMTHLAHV